MGAERIWNKLAIDHDSMSPYTIYTTPALIIFESMKENKHSKLAFDKQAT